MAFFVSPGVYTTETDLTNIIPSVSASTGALCGGFTWGPVLDVTHINNEEQLVDIFGKPSSTNYKDFFTATSFLQYASALKIVRVVDETAALNANATVSAGSTGTLIKNQQHYESTDFSATTVLWVAKYAGTLGNSIGIAWANTAGFDAEDSNGYTWPFRDSFTSAPSTNEYHIVVYDYNGGITGTTGTILETWAFVSSSTTALYYDGSSAYFKTRINNGSKWLWIGKASLLTGSSDGFTLAGGANGAAIGDTERQAGLVLFKNQEELDISLVMAGGASTTTAKYIIDNIAEYRKDCIAFVSPQEADVVNIFSEDTILDNILTTRNTLGSSSYAVMDSAYKYTYDRYNDTNRWIPLNGDIAGLCAKTDNDFDAWFSPAGLNRGRIKGVITFSHPQPLTIRDELYKSGVNPCVSFPLDGPVLYGDKTLLARPSAFDRINVRRLFIVLEKAIAKASRYIIFEQNDEETRAQFVNAVEPFLRDVQGRRGIQDFRVVCDESNNTAEVVDRNEFVGDIYIKPTRSINFIRLNFVSVRSGTSFEEIIQG